MMGRLAGRAVSSRVFWIAVFLLLWQLTAKSGRVSPLLLPDLGSVLQALYKGLVSGELPAQTGLSLALIGLGMLIAVLLALLLSAGAFSSKAVAGCADALCVLAHPLPAIALLPVIILWFGTGFGATLAVIVHSVLWPMLLNLTAGFRAVPAIYVHAGKNLGLGRGRLLWEVYLPGAMSYALAGLKIGWARAWRALISAEMVFGAVGGSGGLGWYLFKSRVMMNTAGLFAGVMVIIVIGVLVEELLLVRLEAHTVRRWGMSAPPEGGGR